MKCKIIFLLFLFLFLIASTAVAFNLPDTGQTNCYRGDYPFDEILCAGTGQDGDYNINPISFTDNGNGTVTDNNIGLMWQKEDDGNSYKWGKASGTYDKVYNPTSLDVCGSLVLGSYSDWRLPAKKELMSILYYSIPYPEPTIYSTYFPNTKSSHYWSSTTDANLPYYAWFVDFSNGDVGSAGKNNGNYYVRCVRGGQYPEQNLIDNKDGTVTDNATGLVWQQASPAYMTWASALSYCNGLPLGGKTDWRLPNIKELESITDDTRYNPAIDTTFFLSPSASSYWSSTTKSVSSSSYAWSVSFNYGTVYSYYNKSGNNHIRCVRGGQVGHTPTKYILTVENKGNGSGSVTSSDGKINCGSGMTDCSAEYDEGTSVTLTATSDEDSTFAYWDDGTKKYTKDPLSITMDSGMTLTVTFIKRLLTTSWDQAKPYMYCYDSNNDNKDEQYRVGCSAVAVGQLVNYYLKQSEYADEWLDILLKGVKVYPRFNNKMKKTVINNSEGYYIYNGYIDSITDEIQNNYCQDQDKQSSFGAEDLREFLWNVALGLDSNFKQNATGAGGVYREEFYKFLLKPNKFEKLLIDRFRFQNIRNEVEKVRNNLNRLDIEKEYIKESIDDEHPVLITMRGIDNNKSRNWKSIGHAVIIDGYRETTDGGFEVLINWGWGNIEDTNKHFYKTNGPIKVRHYTFSIFNIIYNTRPLK